MRPDVAPVGADVANGPNSDDHRVVVVRGFPGPLLRLRLRSSQSASRADWKPLRPLRREAYGRKCGDTIEVINETSRSHACSPHVAKPIVVQPALVALLEWDSVSSARLCLQFLVSSHSEPRAGGRGRVVEARWHMVARHASARGRHRRSRGPMACPTWLKLPSIRQESHKCSATIPPVACFAPDS